MVRLRCDPWLEPIYRLRLLMPAEPHIRSPFPERLDTIIPHSRGHRARDGGSTLYFGISQPLFATVRPPGSNAADQASWTRDDNFVLECLSLPSRSHPRGSHHG